jgi:hypothetical protein
MKLAIVALCAGLAACGSGGGDDADLPDGWVNAERIDDFMQMECSGSPIDGGYEEHAMFVPGTGSLHVDYLDAPFRCEQEVEGFALFKPGSLDLLVQPIDMDPESVAACDCLYQIAIDVAGLAMGDLDVSLERRWDNRNEPNDPIPVAARTVTIE